jgi:hypothetical protein
MVIKHHNNKNLMLVLVVIYLVVTIPLCIALLPIEDSIQAIVGTTEQMEPPVAIPLLPPQKAETIRHKPTIPPIEIVTFAPTQTIPDHPEPPPAPDYFKT